MSAEPQVWRDGGQADARAQMRRVGGDREQRVGSGSEQEVVDGGACSWNAIAPIAAGKAKTT